MSGTTRITGTPTSIAEVLSNRLFDRPRRTLMDGELYEALNAARRAAAQPAALSLSPQAKAQVALAAGAVPAAANDQTRTSKSPEPAQDSFTRAVDSIGRVDVRA